MDRLDVDVAVIGSGTAGLGAYRAARAHTDSIVLIEAGQHGTTCARVGCMPSKLLVAAAEAAHGVGQASAFGIHPQGPVRIDGREVMARVKRERDRFVGFVLESEQEFPAAHKLQGHARFRDEHTLLVDDHTEVHADRIVIATGSRPSYPPFLKAAGARLVVNDDLFEWDDLPRRVAVFGPGVIGLELGQALHRLGVRVLMFGVGGQVGPLTDPHLLEYARATFGEQFYLNADADVAGVAQVGDDEVELTIRQADGSMRTERVDYVLAATGRRPNVDRLGLDHLPLERDARGVPMADPFTLQTSMPHLFIAGDASSQLPLLHEAADQGRIAGDNAGRYPDIRAGLRRSRISVVFSDPQIAMVGSSYRDLQQRFGDCGCFAVGEVSFEDQGRSRVMLKNKGSLRVYGEHGTGLFLGAEMLAPAAEHLAHLLAWSHQQKLTVSQMLQLPFYHPVIEEGVRTALRDLNAKLHLGPESVRRCMDCGPGC